jgi:hypothetical protein
MNGIDEVFEGHLIVRLVPVSADQARVLESLDRAFFSLLSDFQRDMGALGGDEIAGGLFRISSTLDGIARSWKESAEDVADVERRRAALERIRDGGLDDVEARALARDALR